MEKPIANATYEDALAYIASHERFGSKLGLETIGHLLDRLGNPQKGLNFIHVAGTNGKGSTTAMIAGALTAAGYKTGMYISPAVEAFSERIQINMAPAGEERIAAAVFAVKAAADAMEAAGEGVVTEFEIVTSAAFLVYRDCGCDFAVLETGLGGRYDATNIIDWPLAAVITSVSFDHMAVLGDTLEKIAAEKCGIIKNGCPVVAYAEQPPEALHTIQAHCEAAGSALIVPRLDAFSVVSLDLDGTRFLYEGKEYATPMTGVHFAKNALSAIETLKLLAKAGYAVDDAAISAGIAGKPMAARMEKIYDEPCVLLDGAHNPDGVEKLCQTIDTVLQGRRIITVMGMLRDKDYGKCIPEIAQRSDVFIATTPPSPRALPAREAAALANGKAPLVCIAQRTQMAFISAMRFAKPGDVVLCCGSLSFLGGCKETLRYLIEMDAKYNIF